MNYPLGVPAGLYSNFDAVIAEEDVVFSDAARGATPHQVYDLAVEFAAKVVLGCARVVLRDGSWPLAQFERVAPELQRLIVVQTYYDKVPRDQRTMHGDESFARAVDERLKKLPEWRKHLRERRDAFFG